MNPVIPAGGSAVSPRLLLASLCLHCLALCTASLLAPGKADLFPVSETGSVRVRLVNPQPIQISTETAKSMSVSDPTFSPSLPTLDESRRENRVQTVESVKTAAVRSRSFDHVPLVKRKRAPKKIEPAKPEKAGKEPAEDKDTGEEGAKRIEKRLAGIRDEVEKRRSAAEKGTGTEAVTAHGSAAPSAADPDLTAWLSQVRNRINANWTLFQEVRDKSPATVIGVRISDDGALIGAAVDRGSGDEIFDRSALRAVHQASPLPPPPPSVRQRIADSGGLALRFTPRGMQ
jgi:TonB family protein